MAGPLLRFDDAELDVARYELRQQGDVLRLERLPMELLILLASRRGELVSREEVIERLWGKGVCLDVDQGINTAIRKIRRCLGDAAENPRYIQTVVGKGYRFLPPVTISEPGTSVPVALDTAAAPPLLLPAVQPPPVSHSLRFRRTIWMAVAAVAVVVAVALGGYRYTHREPQSTTICALAVLPFANLSGDPAQDFFVDGVTDELITELARMGGVRVISRTSSMRYKRAHENLPQIARELGVDAVVEGAVARSGNHVRITVQLIRAASDQHLWANEYDRDVSDILGVQAEIAAAMARELPAEAISEFQQTQKALPGWSVATAAIGWVNGTSGKPSEARRALEQLQALSKKRYVTAYAIALIYASLNDKDKAFRYLDQGAKERTNWMVWTPTDPRWKSIRSDPRFSVLLRQIGFGTI